MAQRERELAIRAAVGASRSSLLSMVLREGVLLSGAGIVAGAVIAAAASSVLGSLLYDVSATRSDGVRRFSGRPRGGCAGRLPHPGGAGVAGRTGGRVRPSSERYELVRPIRGQTPKLPMERPAASLASL